MQITYSGQTAQLVITQNADYVVSTTTSTSQTDRQYHLVSLGSVSEAANCMNNAVIGFNGNAYDTYTEITYKKTTYKSGNATSTEISRTDERGSTRSMYLNAIKYFTQFTIRTSGQSQSISNASVGSTGDKVNATVTLTSDVTDKGHAATCLEGTADVTMTFNGSSYTTNNVDITMEGSCIPVLCEE